MTDGKRRLAGRYRIDGLLGRGGMSEVHFGYDERLDRPVAVKLLRPPSFVPATPDLPDSPEAVEILDALERDQRRFLREIRLAARLELAGVPAVYDTGVDDRPDGTRQLWLVMQLLRGSTLETLIDGASFAGSGDLPGVAWAAAVTAQVAAVLADVHRVDIVHRDIKAANIMVTDGGLVKVLDFGIAILRGAGALPRLTQVDRTVGTPAYMSPEQWAGQLVTPASDVYSLGCLLFELLTGDVPFHGSTRVPLRVAHQESAVPSVCVARPDGPTAIDALVTAMLAKDPAARPAADAVYLALLPFAAGAVPVADGILPGGDERRDPVRPFRRPLLGSGGHELFLSPGGNASDATHAEQARPLTEEEARRLRADVQVLLQGDQESRFVVAQLLASTGEMVSALAELRAVRPLLAAAYGPDSAQVSNLDKQAARLQPGAHET